MVVTLVDLSMSNENAVTDMSVLQQHGKSANTVGSVIFGTKLLMIATDRGRAMIKQLSEHVLDIEDLVLEGSRNWYVTV